MVRHKIAKDSSWVRIRVTAAAIACALALRREFDARSRIAIRFDPRGHRGSFFLPFFTGPNSRNPVKLKTRQVVAIKSIDTIAFATLLLAPSKPGADSTAPAIDRGDCRISIEPSIATIEKIASVTNYCNGYSIVRCSRLFEKRAHIDQDLSVYALSQISSTCSYA